MSCSTLSCSSCLHKCLLCRYGSMDFTSSPLSTFFGDAVSSTPPVVRGHSSSTVSSRDIPMHLKYYEYLRADDRDFEAKLKLVWALWLMVELTGCIRCLGREPPSRDWASCYHGIVYFSCRGLSFVHCRTPPLWNWLNALEEVMRMSCSTTILLRFLAANVVRLVDAYVRMLCIHEAQWFVSD